MACLKSKDASVVSRSARTSTAPAIGHGCFDKTTALYSRDASTRFGETLLPRRGA